MHQVVFSNSQLLSTGWTSLHDLPCVEWNAKTLSVRLMTSALTHDWHASAPVSPLSALTGSVGIQMRLTTENSTMLSVTCNLTLNNHIKYRIEFCVIVNAEPRTHSDDNAMV